MNGISRRAFLVASTALAGTAFLTKGAFAQDYKESAFLQAAGRWRRAAAGRRAPARESAGDHAVRARRPAGRRLEPCAGGWRVCLDAGALPGLRRSGPLHARLDGHRDQRGRELRGQRGCHRVHDHPAQGPQVVGRPAVHHCRRAVLVRRLLHRRRDQPGRQRVVVVRRRKGQDRGYRRADLQGHLRQPQRLLPAADGLGRPGPAGAVPQALSRAVPHPLQSRGRQSRQGGGTRELDRTVPAGNRLPRHQRLFPEHQATRADRMGLHPRGCKRPRAEHRECDRGTQPVLPQGRHRRARSSPTSTASTTRWSPIPKCFC